MSFKKQTLSFLCDLLALDDALARRHATKIIGLTVLSYSALCQDIPPPYSKTHVAEHGIIADTCHPATTQKNYGTGKDADNIFYIENN